MEKWKKQILWIAIGIYETIVGVFYLLNPSWYDTPQIIDIRPFFVCSLVIGMFLLILVALYGFSKILCEEIK